MKKFWIVFGLIWLLLLTGCSQKPVDMSFDETYSVFVDNLNVWSLINEFMLSGVNFVWEHFSMGLLANNEQMDMDVSFLMESKTNKKTLDSTTKLSLSADIQDKVNQMPILASGQLEILSVNNKAFLRIWDFDIDMWPWRAEANLINMMLKNFTEQRIQLDYEDIVWDSVVWYKDAVQLSKLFSNVLDMLDNNVLFENVEKIIYQWKVAYRIRKNWEVFDLLYDELLKALGGENLSGEDTSDSIEFEWLLVIQDKNTVDLVIEKLKIAGLPVNISWLISQNHINAVFGEENGSKLDLDIKVKRRVVDLSFVGEWPGQPSVVFDGELIPQSSEHKLHFMIDGVFEVEMPNNALSNQETVELVSYDFEWEYYADSIDSFVIKEPDSYLLMSQVLWDPYAFWGSWFNQ